MEYFAHAGEDHAASNDSLTGVMIAAILLALFLAVTMGIYLGKKRSKTAVPDKKTEIE